MQPSDDPRTGRDLPLRASLRAIRGAILPLSLSLSLILTLSLHLSLPLPLQNQANTRDCAQLEPKSSHDTRTSDPGVAQRGAKSSTKRVLLGVISAFLASLRFNPVPFASAARASDGRLSTA